MNITNYITHRLADADRYVLTSDIPTEHIAIFTDDLFFNWKKEVAECAEAIRQVVKAEGKSYFVITCNSTFHRKDMRYILESGLARIAGHAFVDRICKWTGDRWSEGVAIVFEII